MNEALANRGKGSGNDSWETPPWLFQALHSEFGFTWDAAASAENHLCPTYSSLENPVQNVIFGPRERVFCNPPYSDIDTFVDIALASPSLWVFVLPAFTDKLWFRHLKEAIGRQVEFRPFLKRVRFYDKGKPGGSPFFGSVIVILYPR